MTRHFAATALLLAVAACGPRKDDPRAAFLDTALSQVAATVAEGGGDMQVKRSAQLEWASASVGTTFMDGDWLRTGPRAYVRVEYVRGGRIELEEKAMVLIELSSAEGPEREAQVAVEVGTVGGQLDAKDKAVVIRTKAKAPARLRSTSDVPLDYRLSRKQNATEVAVRRGEAVLEVGGQRQSLKAGEASEIRDDDSPAQVVKLLPPPTAQSPAANAHVIFEPNVAITLSWKKVEGAAGYRLQVARDAMFRQPVLDLQQPEVAAPLLPADPGRYFWRLSAQDVDGRWGHYSQARSLHVDREPLEDKLQSPNDGAVIGFVSAPPSLTFAWETIDGAQGYRLLISKNADLSEPVVDESVQATRRNVALPPGGWFWGVEALGDSPLPLFQQPRSFVVKKVEQAKMKIPEKLENWGD